MRDNKDIKGREILTENRAAGKNDTKLIIKISDYFFGVLFTGVGLAGLAMMVVFLCQVGLSPLLPLAILLLDFLLVTPIGLRLLDNVILSDYGVEVIEYDETYLYIRRKGCIFRRNVKIPIRNMLSVAYGQRMQEFPGTSKWPERINIVYQFDILNIRVYSTVSLGLHLTAAEAQKISHDIMNLLLKDMENIIKETVERLNGGDTVVMPTDTIWGIGCDATNAAAVERVYLIKERERSKSMLVLMNEEEWMKEKPEAYGQLSTAKNEGGRPTTVIVPVQWLREHGVAMVEGVEADDGTVGVRIPYNHEFSQRVLAAFGKPIISTSANLSGHQSPKNYKDIDRSIVERVDYCVPETAATRCCGKQASRIVKLMPDGKIITIRE